MSGSGGDAHGHQRTDRRASVRLLGALAAELGGGTVLVVVLRSAGMLGSPTDAAGTWRTGDPLDVAAWVGGIVALLLLCWVTAATALHLLALLVAGTSQDRRRGRRVSDLAARLGPRWLAAFATTAALAGVGATGCSTAAPGAAPATHLRSGSLPAGRTPVTMVLEQPATAPPTMSAGVPTMVIDTAPDHAATPPPSTPPPSTPPPSTPPAPPGLGAEPRSIRVARGDSFWTIAERAVSERLGRPAGVAETATYWRTLVEVNRDRLVDRDDADLLYPGQQLVLP